MSIKRLYTKSIEYTILYSEVLFTSKFTGKIWFDIFSFSYQKYVKPYFTCTFKVTYTIKL